MHRWLDGTYITPWCHIKSAARAIEVSYAGCKYEFDQLLDLTAAVFYCLMRKVPGVWLNGVTVDVAHTTWSRFRRKNVEKHHGKRACASGPQLTRCLAQQ